MKKVLVIGYVWPEPNSSAAGSHILSIMKLFKQQGWIVEFSTPCAPSEFSVDLEKVYDKIVTKNRGGICYESHTLFIYLLKSLGFTAHLIFAKVEDLTYIGKDYPHLVILVKIEGIDYLVDVANGQNVREPLNINDENFISNAEDNEYKINQTNNQYTLLVSHKQKDWLPRYYFTLEEKTPSDFKNMFPRNKDQKYSNQVPLLITLATKNGRITLYDNTMIVKDDKSRHSWKIHDETREETLNEYFNMVLDI